MLKAVCAQEFQIRNYTESPFKVHLRDNKCEDQLYTKIILPGLENMKCRIGETSNGETLNGHFIAYIAHIMLL